MLKKPRFLLAILLVSLFFISIIVYPSFFHLTVAQPNDSSVSDRQDFNAELLSLQTNISRLEAQYDDLNTRYGMLPSK